MNKAERQQLIMNRITQEHHIYISMLCEELGTSYDSIRRDITELDETGKLTRVHGGAIAKMGIPIEYTKRSDLENSAKQHLANKDVKLFNDGDTLLIDGGTSNMELVRQLPCDKKFTIYTNSLPIASEFCERNNLDIHLLGGRVYAPSLITIGIPVVNSLQTIRPDWLSLGVCAIDPQIGITTILYEESLIKRAMIECARQCIVMADNSKLNTAEQNISATLRDIDYLIVEDNQIDSIRKEWPQFSYYVI